MKKLKNPQDIEEQIQRIAHNIDSRILQLEDERSVLIQRMNKLALMSENIQNPHALIPNNCDNILECIFIKKEMPIIFDNIFELRKYLYRRKKGDKHYEWKPLMLDMDKECYKQLIHEEFFNTQL